MIVIEDISKNKFNPIKISLYQIDFILSSLLD